MTIKKSGITIIPDLPDDELNALEGRVKITSLQDGCPGQCLGCGSDAPELKNYMQWKKAKAIAEDTQWVKENRGIDILNNQEEKNRKTGESLGFRVMLLSTGSDIVHYRSTDNQGIKRTCWDIGKLFFDLHGMHLFCSTAGWKPGDNFRQKAMEQIVDDHLHGDQIVKEFYYSIKPFGALFIRDIDRFFKDSGIDRLMFASMGFVTQKKCFLPHLWNFFDKSKYVRFVIENMKLLRETNTLYSVQSLGIPGTSNTYFSLLPPDVRQYGMFFGPEFMEMLASYCALQSQNDMERKEHRPWHGGGRGHRDLGAVQLNPISWQSWYKRTTSDTRTEQLNRGMIFIQIEHDGEIAVKCGEKEGMSTPSIPKQYLSGLAEHFRATQPKVSEQYSIFTNLQGRNIFL